MGAYGWQRDKKGSAGKSFATGNVILPSEPTPKRRKLVWKREGLPPSADAQPPQAAERPSPPAQGPATGSSTPASAATRSPANEVPAPPCRHPHQSHQLQPSPGSSSRAPLHSAHARRPPPASQGLDAKQANLDALRQQILSRQAQVEACAAARQAAARRAANAEEQQRQKELRRRKLEAGFSEAFEAAKAAAAQEIAAGRAAAVSANECEVQRVLRAKSDYDVLQLEPGADAAAVRRRFREMAVTLHPDKCRLPGASDAFQRLVLAFQGVAKYAK